MLGRGTCHHAVESVRFRARRSHVIYALPRLKSMDFSAVTPQERVMARYWHHGLQAARRNSEDPDDL